MASSFQYFPRYFHAWVNLHSPETFPHTPPLWLVRERREVYFYKQGGEKVRRRGWDAVDVVFIVNRFWRKVYGVALTDAVWKTLIVKSVIFWCSWSQKANCPQISWSKILPKCDSVYSGRKKNSNGFHPTTIQTDSFWSELVKSWSTGFGV